LQPASDNPQFMQPAIVNTPPTPALDKSSGKNQQLCRLNFYSWVVQYQYYFQVLRHGLIKDRKMTSLKLAFYTFYVKDVT